jgi:hypothetical protein
LMDGGFLRRRFVVLSVAHFGLVLSLGVPTAELVCFCVGWICFSFFILGVRVSTWGCFVGGRLDNFHLRHENVTCCN